MKRLVAVLFVLGIVLFFLLETANASFFFTRYQNQRIQGETVHQTCHIAQIDWDDWTFGSELGTASKNDFMYVTPFAYHNISFLGKGWQGGIRFEHDSFDNNSIAPSIRYAGVNEVWKGQKMLFLFQGDYYLGSIERLELWGNITIPLFSEMPGFGWRLGIEGYVWASPEGERNYQIRFPRLGYRLPGFGPFNAITPAIMLEHQWDGRGTNSFIESNSAYFMLTFNF